MHSISDKMKMVNPLYDYGPSLFEDPDFRDEELCYKCLEYKPSCGFFKFQINRRGVSPYCKKCHSAYYHEKNAANPEQVRTRNREYYKNNREICLKSSRKWHRENPHKSIQSRAKRRAFKQNASPPWLSPDHHKTIADLYWLAKDLEKVSGYGYHVDHIIPLNNEHVCGLHVPWNLQILPSDLNISKSNSFQCWWID